MLQPPRYRLHGHRNYVSEPGIRRRVVAMQIPIRKILGDLICFGGDININLISGLGFNVWGVYGV